MSTFYLIRGTDPSGSEHVALAGEMIVGRSDECDLKVQDGHPSRRHARLTLAEGKLWVEDLGSANGTFVNDRQISEPTELRPGDRLAFDLATFVVASPQADDQATVVRRAPPDADATVVRPAPAAAPPKSQDAQPAAPQKPPPVPPEPAPAPAEPPPAEPRPERTASAPDKAGAHVPRSWADPNFQTAGTRVLSREELAAMAAGGSAPGQEDDVAGPHLRVLGGDSAGSVLTFDSPGQEWSVGSDEGRDLRLTDPGISGFHAKITRDGTRWRIIDQMSANGTFVNGDKVTVSYLGNGDRLRFAQVECEVRFGDAGRGAARKAGGRSTTRTWIIAAVAAAATVGVLAVMSWFG